MHEKAASYNGFAAATPEQRNTPRRLSDDSLWVMFESTLMLVVTEHAKTLSTRESSTSNASLYKGFERRFRHGHSDA